MQGGKAGAYEANVVPDHGICDCVVDTGIWPVSVPCKKYERYDMDPAAESQEMKQVSAGAKRYNRCIKQWNQPEQLCEGKNATEQARLS